MKRAAIWLANGALVVLCCFLVARILSAVGAEALAPAPTAEAPQAEAAPAQARSWQDRQVILERKLFDTAALAPVEQAEADPEPDYEETRLPLTLHGTVAGHPALSWAAVEDVEARKHLVVRVGDKLKDRAEVVAIERRLIVLQNGGRLEKLSLDEEQDAPAQGAARRGTPRRSAAAPARGDARSRIRQLSENRFAVARQDVAAVASNPAELFSQARILPKYEDGEMRGVQLNAIKPGSIFEQIGIENGDVITEFNGIQVTNQQESAAVLRELTQAKRFDVVVDRGGSPVQLSYEIE